MSPLEIFNTWTKEHSILGGQLKVKIEKVTKVDFGSLLPHRQRKVGWEGFVCICFYEVTAKKTQCCMKYEE